MILGYPKFLLLVSSLLFVCGNSASAADSAATLLRDEVYGRKFGMALTMDVAIPQEMPNGAAMIVVVSGGWYSWWKDEYEKPYNSDVYLKAGYTVFTVRHSGSPRFSIAEALSDVKRAVRFIRFNAEKYGIDPNRIGVTGNSAGGHLSLMLGVTGDDGDPEAKHPINRESCRVAAVAALVPPTDLTHLVWTTPEQKERYGKYPALDISEEAGAELSPVNFVTADDAPALFYMGEVDEIVPPEHGEWMKHAYNKQGLPSRMHVFENSPHWPGEANCDRFQADALDWFATYLLSENEAGR